MVLSATVKVFVEEGDRRADHIVRHVVRALEQAGAALTDACAASLHVRCRLRPQRSEPCSPASKQFLVTYCTEAERALLLGNGFDEVILPTTVERLFAKGPGLAKTRGPRMLSDLEGALFDLLDGANGRVVERKELLALQGESRALRTRRHTMQVCRLRKKLLAEDAERIVSVNNGFYMRRV